MYIHSYSERKFIFSLLYFVFHKFFLVFSLESVVFMQSQQQYLLRCVKTEVGSQRGHTSITPVPGHLWVIDSPWWGAQFHFHVLLLLFILLLNDSELRRKWSQFLEGSDLSCSSTEAQNAALSAEKSAPKGINKNLTVVLISGRAGCEHSHIRAHWSSSHPMFCVSQLWLAQISL